MKSGVEGSALLTFSPLIHSACIYKVLVSARPCSRPQGNSGKPDTQSPSSQGAALLVGLTDNKQNTRRWISGLKTVIRAWKKIAGSCDGNKSKRWGDVFSFTVVKAGVNVLGLKRAGSSVNWETSETQCIAKRDRASSRATPQCCVSWESKCCYSMWMGSPGKGWALFKAPLGFPGGSDGKESACNAGGLGSVPGWERLPGGGHGNPLQYSFLENSVDRGVWWATVHGVKKSQTQLSD